jgi:hypothetical protein
MTHVAGSVTTQSTVFKYVMASEPKNVLNLTNIFLDSGQNFRKVRKKIDFSPK